MAKLAPADFKTASQNRYQKQAGDPNEGWILETDHMESDADSADSFENRTEGAVASSGALKFDRAKGYIHGTPAAPIDGVITYDSAGAILGARVAIFHSDTGIAFPAETVFPQGITANGQYLAEELNVWELVCVSLAPFRVLAAPVGYRETDQLARLQNSNTIEVKADGANRFFANVRRWLGNSGSSYTLPTTDTDSGRPIVIFANDGPVDLSINLANVRDGQYHLLTTKGATPTNRVRVIINGQQEVTNQVLLAPSETQVVPDVEVQSCYFDITTDKSYLVLFDRGAGVGRLYWVQEFGTGSFTDVFEKDVKATGSEITYGASITPNMATGRRFWCTLTGNTIIAGVNNQPTGPWEIEIDFEISAAGASVSNGISGTILQVDGKDFFPANTPAGRTVKMLLGRDAQGRYTYQWETFRSVNTDQPPTYSAFTLSGNGRVDGDITITAGTYSDPNGDVERTDANGTFYDVRSFNSLLTAQNYVAGQDNTLGTSLVSGPWGTISPKTYEPNAGQVGLYIAGRIRPVSQTGTSPVGADVYSNIYGPLAAAASLPTERVLWTSSAVIQTAGAAAQTFNIDAALPDLGTGSDRRLQIKVHGEKGSGTTGRPTEATLNGVAFQEIGYNDRGGGNIEFIWWAEILAANIPAAGTLPLVLETSSTHANLVAEITLVENVAQTPVSASLIKGLDDYSANQNIEYPANSFNVPGPGLLITAATSSNAGNTIAGLNGQTVTNQNIGVSPQVAARHSAYLEVTAAANVTSNFSTASGGGTSIQVFFPAP